MTVRPSAGLPDRRRGCTSPATSRPPSRDWLRQRPPGRRAPSAPCSTTTAERLRRQRRPPLGGLAARARRPPRAGRRRPRRPPRQEVAAAREPLDKCPPVGRHRARAGLPRARRGRPPTTFDAAMLLAVDASLLTDGPDAGGPSPRAAPGAPLAVADPRRARPRGARRRPGDARAARRGRPAPTGRPVADAAAVAPSSTPSWPRRCTGAATLPGPRELAASAIALRGIRARELTLGARSGAPRPTCSTSSRRGR